MPHITPLQFLQTLFPEPLQPARLVLWTKSRRGGTKHSDWLQSLDQAARLAHQYRQSRDVYFSVVLQDKNSAMKIARRRLPRVTARSVRGSDASAMLMTAIWADLDVAGPGHASDRLPPDRDAALGLMAAVPKPPSIVVNSGGGFHVYWLLRQPLRLDSQAARADAKGLVRRVQGALFRAAEARGWRIDNTANLAQLLRLPGTINHKTANHKTAVKKRRASGHRYVTVEQFPMVPHVDAARYDPADFDSLEEAPAAVRSAPLFSGRLSVRRNQPVGNALDAGPPADFRPVYEGCSWLRHCYEDRTALREPEWYAALTIIGRCAIDGADGRRLAHRISRDHPGYSPSRTDDKLDHALASYGPRTCRYIAEELHMASTHCARCPNLKEIKSPIVLGRRELEPLPVSAEKASDGEVAAAGEVSPDGEALTAELPEIVITTREGDVNDQALVALVQGERNLYQRGGLLVQVVGHCRSVASNGIATVGIATGDGDVATDGIATDGGAGESVPVDDQAPAVVKPVQPPILRELLTRHCSFKKLAGGKADSGFKPAHPPRWTVQALLGRGVWPGVPTLRGLVEGPVLRPDGTVLQVPGFDRETGLAYMPSGDFAAVPERPDPRQVRAAIDLLREAVCNFPFRTEAHFAGWLSSVLTPLARPAFVGPSPLNLIDANLRGTGKSLLVDVCSTLLTGRPAARMSHSTDEDEIRKQITGLAMEATQLVLIDNITGVFGSPTLDRALTATSWRDRLLGSNLQVSLPLAVTWYATGNNIILKGDTTRRCLHIRLESSREAPERRTDFRHPRLLSWVRRQRHRLLPAALTLLRGYTVAGRPCQDLPGWGSYDGWSDLVRSAIVWAGLPDPADTRHELEATSATEDVALRDLVHGLGELLEVLGGTATSGEILAALANDSDANSYQQLRAALREYFPSSRPPTATQLSNRLGTYRGRLTGGACIEQGPRSYKGIRWSVRWPVEEVA